MKDGDLLALLEAVSRGETPPGEAAERLAELSFADLDFAKLDLGRELRTGLPEAVFAEGKTPDELAAIAATLLESHGRVLVTRLDAAAARILGEELPEAVYHRRARLLTCGPAHRERPGRVAVLAAGTADLAVAEEAARSLEWFGHRPETHYDIGLAGLQRLLSRLDSIRRARVLVVVAGMDGALPTLVAGLVRSPVVAVPTSVGYGSSFEGLAALLTMLNACAPGVAVVNIDNGYGAAVTAARILAAASPPGTSPDPR